jgi:hypothetical protein
MVAMESNRLLWKVVVAMGSQWLQWKCMVTMESHWLILEFIFKENLCFPGVGPILTSGL